MVYTQEQLKSELLSLIDKFEDEVVEFKEATTNYSFKDIGKYFSALSNEANLSLENYHELKKKNLVEGRYPNIFVSFKVANAVGERTRYITNRGLDENICRELVLQALKIQPATMWEILEVLDRGALSAVLTDVQKQRKVSNLLQKMKNENLIHPEGPRNKTRWHINK